MIRLDGAISLCKSLAFCTTLIHLDLSFNALGSVAGMHLGTAIHENKVDRLFGLFAYLNGVV